MRFNRYKYYFEEGVKSIFRNGLMSLSSMVTVMACIFILIFAYCVAVNVDSALYQLENSIGITVSISDDCTGDELSVLYEKITSLDNVDSVTFISAEEGLKQLAESLGQADYILDTYLLDNPIPRSFDIRLKNMKYQADTIATLSSEAFRIAGVDVVRHAMDATEVLVNISSIVRVVSLFMLFIMVLLSIIIIVNTIKITVNSRKNEISIMRYVGATKWFIRWPFIVEGILIGLVGAIIPIVICWLTYNYAIESVSNSFSLIKEIFDFKPSIEIFPLLSPFAAILGGLIGAAGSITSVRKYLNA